MVQKSGWLLSEEISIGMPQRYAMRFVKTTSSVCNQGSQHNSNVIPGKLAMASATRNPGVFKHFWIPVFTGMTTEGSVTLGVLPSRSISTFGALVNCPSAACVLGSRIAVHGVLE
jgi:hypothetical protein